MNFFKHKNNLDSSSNEGLDDQEAVENGIFKRGNFTYQLFKKIYLQKNAHFKNIFKECYWKVCSWPVRKLKKEDLNMVQVVHKIAIKNKNKGNSQAKKKFCTSFICVIANKNRE